MAQYAILIYEDEAAWMGEVEEIITMMAPVKDGFKPIRELADECLARRSEGETLVLAHDLYRSDVHQARIMATILFGLLSPARSEVFTFLRDVVSHDPDCRTQEMLAMAFDTYCKGVGYEQALPDIESWLGPQSECAPRGLRGSAHLDPPPALQTTPGAGRAAQPAESR